VRWASHNVRRHTSGSKRMRHPVVGEIELNYQSFEMPGEPGLRFNVFTAEPETPNQQALRFLASWAGGHAMSAESDRVADERS
jgi:MmyB-like transcription regulator ligand binding domain